VEKRRKEVELTFVVFLSLASLPLSSEWSHPHPPVQHPKISRGLPPKRRRSREQEEKRRRRREGDRSALSLSLPFPPSPVAPSTSSLQLGKHFL